MVNEKFRERVQPWDVSFEQFSIISIRNFLLVSGDQRASGTLRSIFSPRDGIVAEGRRQIIDERTNDSNSFPRPLFQQFGE